MANTKDHAHELIDRLAPSQVPVAIRFLEIILDPATRSLATAPIEDLGDSILVLTVKHRREAYR